MHQLPFDIIAICVYSTWKCSTPSSCLKCPHLKVIPRTIQYIIPRFQAEGRPILRTIPATERGDNRAGNTVGSGLPEGGEILVRKSSRPKRVQLGYSLQ